MFEAEELTLDLEENDFLDRSIETDELDLETDNDFMAPSILEDAISIEGVELEEEMHFIKQHFCREDGDLPLFVLVEDEYFKLGMMRVQFESVLSLASVGAGYRLFLHMDGKSLSLTEPENLIRLIEL